MAVAGPFLYFYYVETITTGRNHDSKVLKNSSLWASMEQGEGPFPGAVLLGDSGYPLREWLITPYPGEVNIQNTVNPLNARWKVHVEKITE